MQFVSFVVKHSAFFILRSPMSPAAFEAAFPVAGSHADGEPENAANEEHEQIEQQRMENDRGEAGIFLGTAQAVIGEDRAEREEQEQELTFEEFFHG